MNFNDPYRDKCVQEESCTQGLTAPSMLGQKPQQPLMGRMFELEQALEAAAKALQDIYGRLQNIENALGL